MRLALIMTHSTVHMCSAVLLKHFACAISNMSAQKFQNIGNYTDVTSDILLTIDNNHLRYYSIDICPARNSRLLQPETNHYIARCASILARSYLAGFWPAQVSSYRPFCTASSICCSHLYVVY